MSDTFNLQYSDEGSASRYMFYKDSQEVNIFVEDEGKEFEYEEIFSKLLPNIKILTLFSTGGKLAMKERFKEFGQFNKDNYIPNIYIADGDFDILIKEREMIKDDHFIYLDAYNIEDYFFDEEACVKFAVGRLKKPAASVRTKIDFDGWYNKIISQSKKLFLLYCFIQNTKPEVPNTANSPYIFIDGDTGFERAGAFNDYKTKLLNEYGIDVDLHKDDIDKLEKKYISIYENDFWRLICGKFMLKSLMCYLRSKKITSISEDELRWWLISNVNISKLQFLYDLINGIVCRTQD